MYGITYHQITGFSLMKQITLRCFSATMVTLLICPKALFASFLITYFIVNQIHVPSKEKQYIFLCLILFRYDLNLPSVSIIFLNPIIPTCSLNFLLKIRFKDRIFFHHKDRLPVDLCSKIIYKYTCRTCQGSYIGSTVKQSKIVNYQ